MDVLLPFNLLCSIFDSRLRDEQQPLISGVDKFKTELEPLVSGVGKIDMEHEDSVVSLSSCCLGLDRGGAIPC